MRTTMRQLLLLCVATCAMSCSEEVPPASAPKIAVGGAVVVSTDDVLGCTTPDAWGKLRVTRGDAFEPLLDGYIKSGECTRVSRGPARIVDLDTFRRMLQIRLNGQTEQWWVVTTSVDPYRSKPACSSENAAECSAE